MRLSRLIILSVALATVAVCPCCTATQPRNVPTGSPAAVAVAEEYKVLSREAVELAQEGDLDAALKVATDALEASPDAIDSLVPVMESVNRAAQSVFVAGGVGGSLRSMGLGFSSGRVPNLRVIGPNPRRQRCHHD